MPSQHNQQSNNSQFAIAHALDFVSHGTFSDCERTLSKQPAQKRGFSNNNNKSQEKTILERMQEAIEKDNSTDPLLLRILPFNSFYKQTAKQQGKVDKVESTLDEVQEHFESAAFQTMDFVESTLEDAKSSMPDDDTKAAVADKVESTKDTLERVEQQLESAVFQTMDIAESTLEDANVTLEDAKNSLSDTTPSGAIKMPLLFDKKEEDKTTMEQMQEALTGVKEENKGLFTKAKEQWNTTTTSSTASSDTNNSVFNLLKNPFANLFNFKLFDTREENKASVEQMKEAITAVKEQNKGLFTKAKEQWNGGVEEENKGADNIVQPPSMDDGAAKSDEHDDVDENLEQLEQHLIALM